MKDFINYWGTFLLDNPVYLIAVIAIAIAFVVLVITAVKITFKDSRELKELQLKSDVVQISQDMITAQKLFIAQDGLNEDQILRPLSSVGRLRIKSMIDKFPHDTPEERIDILRNQIPRKLMQNAQDFFKKHTPQDIVYLGQRFQSEYLAAQSAVDQLEMMMGD